MLRERAVRGAITIRKAASTQCSAALRSDQTGELLREAALADPRRADHRDEMRAPLVAGLLPQPLEHLELARAPDERSLGQHPARGGGGGADRLPDLDRLGLPLRDHGRLQRVHDGRPRGRVRLGADEDAVHGSRGLQP